MPVLGFTATPEGPANCAPETKAQGQWVGVRSTRKSRCRPGRPDRDGLSIVSDVHERLGGLAVGGAGKHYRLATGLPVLLSESVKRVEVCDVQDLIDDAMPLGAWR